MAGLRSLLSRKDERPVRACVALVNGSSCVLHVLMARTGGELRMKQKMIGAEENIPFQVQGGEGL